MSTATAASLLLSRRQIITNEILDAKKKLNLTWEYLASQLNISPVFLASVCLGENSLDPIHAGRLADILRVPRDVTQSLCEYALKAQTPADVLMQDPLIYRFHEAMMVYGLPLKEVIQEKFGDGIMSAIDFTVDIEKEADPKGDRVKVIMSGKYLPYKKW